MLLREKDAIRIEKVIFDPQIFEMCRDFYEKIGLEYPWIFNSSTWMVFLIF